LILFLQIQSGLWVNLLIIATCKNNRKSDLNLSKKSFNPYQTQTSH